MGTVPLERAYYHCRSCGTGTVPWDEALGLTRQALTPGAREVICLAGAVEHLELRHVEYIPAYRTLAGTGTGLCFADWS